MNAILDKTKDRVTFFEHAIPNLPDTKPRDTEQRSRVIAVEMQWISKHLDLTKVRAYGEGEAPSFQLKLGGGEGDGNGYDLYGRRIEEPYDILLDSDYA